MENILDHILNLNFNEFVNWNSLENRLKKSLKNKFRRILELFSGNNSISLLSDILNKEEKKLLCPNYYQVFLNLSQLNNRTAPKERYKIISCIKRAGISFYAVRQAGFLVSRRLWNSCENEFPRNKGGRLALSEEKKLQINLHMESLSSLASNRIVKLAGRSVNAMYCSKSIKEAYKTFPNRANIPFSSFYKYISKKFKKPHRLTDLCDYCEHGKKLHQQIKNEARANGCLFDIEDEFDCDRLLNVFQDEHRFFDFRKNVNDLKTILFHKKIAQRQREVYNSSRKNTEQLENALLIEIDFKQKINIGIGPRQLNTEYYAQKQKSLLGFGIYHVKKRSNQVNQLVDQQNIDCINFDCIFDGKTDAHSVIQCFRFIRRQPFFKEIDKPSYYIWTDTGKHFRCAELAYYFLVELAEEKIAVNWSFFVEKHGKNQRDQHFSVISKYIRQETFIRKLYDSADIVEAIQNRQQASNEYRVEKEKDELNVIAAEVRWQQLEKRNGLFLKIPNIESLYNLRTVGDQFQIKTSIYSDEFFLYDLNELEMSKKIVLKDTTERQFVEDTVVSIEHLRDKQKNAELLKGVQQQAAFCKLSCQSCKARVKYNLSLISYLNQKDTNEELYKHGHGKSRKINNKSLNTDERKRELKEHYEKYHAQDIENQHVN